MVLQSFRRLAKEEDGQALVLAALLMLAIALAVLSISHLGRTIHDEIRMQNAADATAYTLAAQQARAFNFYAFANRAQIAHYVGVLQVVSIEAIALGLISAMGTFGALLKTAASACAGPKAAACLAIPYVGAFLHALSTIADAAERVLRAAARTLLSFTGIVGRLVIPLLVGANLSLFAAQAAMLASTLGRLREEEVLRIARKTAPDAKLAHGSLPFAQNARRLVDAHLREAMTMWGTSDRPDARLEDGTVGRRNYARRGMGELIHASRHGGWVYDRSLGSDLPGLSALPGSAEVLKLVTQFSGLRLRGHTRLLSAPDSQVGSAQAAHHFARMEKPGYSTARYPTGNAIAANFYLEGRGLPEFLAHPLGVGRKEMGSVTSTGGETKGFACTWDPDDPYDRLPLAIITLHTPKLRCDLHQGRYPWWGITPYMHFDATGAGCDSPEQEFCQPDVWVALEAGGESEALRGEEAILRAAGAKEAFAGTGKVAVARALAYYHRPGSWQEPPNFFNPHWRAKLAPIETGLGRLSGGLGLPQGFLSLAEEGGGR